MINIHWNGLIDLNIEIMNKINKFEKYMIEYQYSLKLIFSNIFDCLKV